MKKFWLFEKTDKVDKHLTRLTKKKTDKTQITNVKNEILKCITTDSADIKGIICIYQEQFYTYKFDNLEEMDQFFQS